MQSGRRGDLRPQVRLLPSRATLLLLHNPHYVAFMPVPKVQPHETIHQRRKRSFRYSLDL